MAKKQTAVTAPVEKYDAATLTTLHGLYKEILIGVLKGAEKWAAVRATYTVGGIVIIPLKKEASGLFTSDWIAAFRARVGRELTVEEVTREKKYAQNEFSRGTKDPNAKPITRGANANKGKTDGKTPETPAGTPEASPGMVASIEQLATRSKAISAGIVAFQNHITAAKVRLPALGIETLGSLTEETEKLSAEIAAILATFK